MGGFVFNTETLINNHITAHNTLNFDRREELLDAYPLYCCPLCYPPSSFESTIEFQNFWNWIYYTHSAQSYTRAIFDSFERYQHTTDILERFFKAEIVICSILFEKKPGSFEFLLFDIQAATDNTANWTTQEATSLGEHTQTHFEINLFENTTTEDSSSTTTETTDSTYLAEANNGMDHNAPAILQALQAIQVSLTRKNVVPLPSFSDNQDPVSWLEDFGRASATNNYDADYKFQVVIGFLKGSAATWFSEATAAGAPNQIIRWSPANAGQHDTSFTTRFIEQFRTPILVGKWRRELQFCQQNSGESIDEYAKRIYRLFKQIGADGPQTESAKIYEFTKGLQPEIAQVIHNHIGFNQNETLLQAIDVTRRIESNQQQYKNKWVSFNTAASAFTVQTPAFSKEIVEQVTARLVELLKLLTQALQQ